MLDFIGRYAIITIFLCVCLAGCSSSGINLVLQDNLSTHDISNTSNIAVVDYDNKGNPSAGYGAIGLFNIYIDTHSFTGEITNLRQSMSPDVLEVVDITNFLQSSPCTDCVKLKSIKINSDGNLVLQIGIKHPFPPGNPEIPITGRNRADLHVFNVEGLVVAKSDNLMNFHGIGERTSGMLLLNADGYSPYLDRVLDSIFTTPATIHPYKLHFNDYSQGNFHPDNPMGFASVTNPPPSGNLVMPMGSDYDFKSYEFGLTPGEAIEFIFAVGCTYAVSADSKAQRFTPEYRVPQHLKKAASEVGVRIVENNLYCGDTTSSALIEIDVVDVSHDFAVGLARDDMRFDSSVGSVRLEIPNVMSMVLNVDLINIGGSGYSSSDPLTYSAYVINDLAASEGIYYGLVKVTDTYPPGRNESELLLGDDGIQRVDPILNPLEGLFSIPEFATYQSFTIHVDEKPFECPDVTFSGVQYTDGFTFSNLYALNNNGANWEDKANQIVAADILSNGEMILIYSNGHDSGYGTYDGILRRVNPHGTSPYIDVVPGVDYPGAIGISMDVDSTDLAIFVTSDLPHTDSPDNYARDYEIDEIVAAAHDFFYVIDPFIGISSEIRVDVGTPIMAIAIDANDDVWVLDVNNIMRKYEKLNNYAENAERNFSLDIATGGAFHGLVYDFVIDYHNEAFFILTNGSNLTDLWRIECDGEYFSSINGNPNPMINVLPSTGLVSPPSTHGVADIVIDNRDLAGHILNGEQNSQIVVVGGEDMYRDSNPYWHYTALISRVDSELGQKSVSIMSDSVEAFTCAAFDQRNNRLWGIAPGIYSASYTVLWLSPSDWY